MNVKLLIAFYSGSGSDETFYVLEGELTFVIGSETRQVDAGAFVSIPKGTPHGFRVDSDTARILNSYVPASWEGAVVAMAAPAQARTLRPAGLPGADMARARELMQKYGMRPILGPDPLRPGVAHP